MVRARPGVAPASLASSIRAAVWSIDADLPLLTFKTVDALYAENAARRRFAIRLASGFALLALGLCVFGICGVVSHSVGEREQELGVRLALGAQPGQIVGPVMTASLVPAAAGAAIGTAAAAVLTRLLEPMLFAIGPTDTATLAAMVALLLVAASAAAWVPARRVVRIDPATSLRSE